MVRYTDRAVCSSDAQGETVNQYRLLSEAGNGTFCQVRWAESAGRRYAVKSFSRHVLDRKVVARFDKDGVTTVPLKERITQELEILGSSDHAHVLTLEEVIDDPEHDCLYAVLEGLRGGQLLEWSNRCRSYSVGLEGPEADAVQRHWGKQVACGPPEALRKGEGVVYQEAVAKHLFKQLLEATAYLHERRVIHKDLKPDNVLLNLPVPVADPRFVRILSVAGWPEIGAPRELGGGQAPEAAKPGSPSDGEGADRVRQLMSEAGFIVKLGDFNTAAVCPTDECLIFDAEGTQQFTPPECFEDHRDGLRGKPRDAWSLGCILFTMFFGRCPFWAEANIHLQLAIMEATVVVPEGVASKEAEELMRGLIRKDTTTRLSAADALKHAWLQ